ncbi:methyltransferase-like protein 22 isoform X1 [Biomphalaria glabrata]|uniref:Methyltransferase-like protein 22 isoform X1 n=1 Tax=Biomphalaria glabrata TaxID=6526 RepID=A0A2C9KX01_BIOGL|nr:methyltransferase-like protein 22 isoform X1 [Biomphalaria glabrata]
MAASNEDYHNDDQVLSDVHTFNVSHLDCSREIKCDSYFTRFYFYLHKNYTASNQLNHLSSQQMAESLYSSITESEQRLDEDGDPILIRKKDKICSNESNWFSQNANYISDDSGLEQQLNPATQKCIDKLEEVDDTHLLISSADDYKCHVITIEHKMETSIYNVGYQVWSGALLMCDYLLSIHDVLDKAHVVDLGCGTGITSIVAAMFAKHVVCTDYSNALLQLAERNWQRNKDFLFQNNCSEMYFKLLDWTVDYPSLEDGTEKSVYGLKPADLDLIEKADIYISAEVIYDEELTLAFFKTAYHLLSISPPKVLYITLEKRIVFSTESQQMCSPAYESFQEHLQDLTSVDAGPVRFSVDQVLTDFPQCFQYARTKYLELWKISSIAVDSG